MEKVICWIRFVGLFYATFHVLLIGLMVLCCAQFGGWYVDVMLDRQGSVRHYLSFSLSGKGHVYRIIWIGIMSIVMVEHWYGNEDLISTVSSVLGKLFLKGAWV